ncbi:MAG: hypothetical protein H6590_06050 [Flavobacteriales bacterium]|nr:hypothetical protein [Flavobacteriales bacterium]
MSPTTAKTERRPLISRDSVVPLGAVVAVVLATFNIGESVGRLEVENRARFEKLEAQLIGINQQLEIASGQRFRRDEMQAWIDIQRATNPTIHWRDVR